MNQIGQQGDAVPARPHRALMQKPHQEGLLNVAFLGV